MRAGRRLWLAWQSLAKLIDQSQRVLAGLVSQMQVNHGAGDLRMTEQLLDRMQMRPRLQQVRGKTVSQRVDRGGRDVELFARDNEQPLQGATGHGTGGLTHAFGQGFG